MDNRYHRPYSHTSASVTSSSTVPESSPIPYHPAITTPKHRRKANANTVSTSWATTDDEVVMCDMEERFDYLFKIVLVGNTGVGKSCLLTRFADNAFSECMTATIGVDFRIRSLEIDGRKAKLQIWDSAGQERFRSLTASYYRGAHAVAVVFDLSVFDSISAIVSTWLDEIDLHCPAPIRRILIGNKSDLVDQRQVSERHAQATADRFDMIYIETSAKTAHNVHEAFETIARDILHRYVRFSFQRIFFFVG